ncbi:uncharacterized protein LOC115764361 [Drosophila novamexicana]|uniref:uncharacterized protein LOC115764361 n=1 Tax=Drosophila novamexicana TaxID=47314 RepID=UPI0011E5EF6A|nr:uncharacterized protein LOC115764361 [Drosophila novamexicana]
MDLKNFEERWRCNHPYDDWTPPFRVGPMEEIFSGGPPHEELSNPLPQPVTQPSLNILAGSSLQKRQHKNEGPHFNPCSIPTDSGLYLRYRNKETNNVLRKLWCLDKSNVCEYPK